MNSDDPQVEFNSHDVRNRRENGALNNPAYRAARREAIRRLNENPEILKRIAALRAQQERSEKMFNASLHSEGLDQTTKSGIQKNALRSV